MSLGQLTKGGLFNQRRVKKFADDENLQEMQNGGGVYRGSQTESKDSKQGNSQSKNFHKFNQKPNAQKAAKNNPPMEEDFDSEGIFMTPQAKRAMSEFGIDKRAARRLNIILGSRNDPRGEAEQYHPWLKSWGANTKERLASFAKKYGLPREFMSMLKKENRLDEPLDGDGRNITRREQIEEHEKKS